jgi:hypothetical protein
LTKVDTSALGSTGGEHRKSSLWQLNNSPLTVRGFLPLINSYLSATSDPHHLLLLMATMHVSPQFFFFFFCPKVEGYVEGDGTRVDTNKSTQTSDIYETNIYTVLYIYGLSVVFNYVIDSFPSLYRQCVCKIEKSILLLFLYEARALNKLTVSPLIV